MRIFITGGSGFVGGHAIEALREGGHEVLALARSERSAAAVEALGATAVRGALGAVPEAPLRGVEVVIHAAAFVEEWGTREQFEEANVVGTTQLLEVAQAAGVGRFIHVGTEAAVFTGQDLDQVTEALPYPEEHRYLYAETKARAEQAVLAANREGFVTLSLRPSLIWGPRDRSVLPTVLEMVEAGRFVWINGGEYARSVTNVRNLTHAMVQALEHGEGGSAYFIADDGETTLREFLTALAGTQGVALPGRSMPAWLVRPLAGVLEDTWRTFGLRSTPPLHRFVAELMSSHVTVDTSKAKAELGYAPVVGLSEGLAEMRA